MTFSSPTEPLAWATAWRAWHFDMAATVCAVLLVAGYAWPLSVPADTDPTPGRAG